MENQLRARPRDDEQATFFDSSAELDRRRFRRRR